MSRAAKQIAMRLMALESDSEEDDDFTAADDDFHDVSVEVPSTHDDPMGDVTSDSGEDDEPDIGGDGVSDNTTPVEVLIGRNNTEWSVIDENAVFPGRASRENILRPAPGLTAYAFQRLRDNPVLDSFLIFFSTDMIETMVKETNRQGTRMKGAQFTEIDLCEMKAFIGLLILRGTYRAAGECVDELWSPIHGRPIFSRTMSLRRFKLIRSILRFDNVETRQGRLSRDKLAAVRLLLDGFVSHSQQAYVPGPSVTVDEQLYPYRGRCRYIQYMPSKPAKYGLKFWLACDSDNYYCTNIQFYCGKDDVRDSDVPLGQHVVLSLTEHLRQSGRNITCDNFFTSVQLAQKLHEANMTLVGTVRSNRRELPSVLATHQRREQFSTVQAVNQSNGCSTLLVSYVAKKNKVVNLISTTHRKATIDHSSEKKKPDVVEYYNHTKGGVDAADERIGTYSTKFKCRRWHVVFFTNILDLSAFNGYAIHSIFEPNWNSTKLFRRRLYLLALGNSLLQDHLDRRSPNLNTTFIVGMTPSPISQKRGVCVRCDYGERKKCSVRCYKCNHFVCKDHLTQICCHCSN